MSRPVILRPEAQDDVAQAKDWYERQREGLGDEFVEAVDRVFARLSATPEIHRIVFKDVRRTKPRCFPYVVYYRVLPDRVEVIAVVHGRRDPGVWQSRA